MQANNAAGTGGVRRREMGRGTADSGFGRRRGAAAAATTATARFRFKQLGQPGLIKTAPCQRIHDPLAPGQRQVARARMERARRNDHANHQLLPHFSLPGPAQRGK